MASRCFLTPSVRHLLLQHLLHGRAHGRGQLSFRVQNCRFLAATAPPLGVVSEQEQKMHKYVDLLLQQNQVINLTAIQTAEEAWERHVKDSLALLPILEGCLGDDGRPRRIIDIGSGAGLPGVIIALARPEWQVTLLDSLHKRCKFVEEAAASIGATNIKVIWCRAEQAGQDKDLREAFDCAIARAVAEMRVLAELALPLVRVGGYLVAAKGPNPQAEVHTAASAVQLLGGETADILTVGSFGPDGQRTAVLVRKAKQTPAIYPRKEGRPQKRPL